MAKKGDPSWLNVARDIACIATGVFGLIYSQVTGVISPELIAAYVALLGVPGVVNLLELRATRRDPSESEPESSASQSSESHGRSSKPSSRSTKEG